MSLETRLKDLEAKAARQADPIFVQVMYIDRIGGNPPRNGPLFKVGELADYRTAKREDNRNELQ